MKKQSGFTLIELIAVMVILAILAVVAIPQFVDLRVEAANAAAAGVGGAIASGSALNYAAGVARSGAPGAARVVSACTGTELAPLLTDTTGAAGTITSGGRLYNITTVSGTIAATGNTATCGIEDDANGDAVQSFTIIGCLSPGCGTP